MNKEDIERVKRELVVNLKDGIEDSLLEEFVENYETWKGKMGSVNAVISHVDPQIPPYSFNEFCKKIIEITKNSLKSEIDYNNLFLTNDEYFKILKENVGNEEKTEKAMLLELNKKFMNNLMSILNKNQLKESVKYKLKEQFVYVEKELDQSLEIANQILKKYGIREDYLITIGARAEFIAEGARSAGLPSGNVESFGTVDDAGKRIYH